MRARKPWVRLRLISLGWYVRCITELGTERARDHMGGRLLGQLVD